jgi:hypothetical protein
MKEILKRRLGRTEENYEILVRMPCVPDVNGTHRLLTAVERCR